MKKLAMIGCGGIGEYHLGHFLTYGDLIELVGFCDLIPEKAERFVEKAGCGKAFTDYKVMLDEVQPDIVFICIPPYCHGEIEFTLIERGIHFFVEKPMSLDIKLAKKIRDAIEEKGLITAVGFQCRYNNFSEAAKEFCEKNQVIFVDCTRFGGIPNIEWWRHKELSGGQLVECTIHNCDLLRYTVGEISEVCSYRTGGFITDAPEGYTNDDCTVTIIKFENGALGTIGTGCYAKSGNAYESKTVFSTRDKRAEWKIGKCLDIYGEVPAVKAEGEVVFAIKGDGAVGASGDKITIARTNDPGIDCDRTYIEAVISGDDSKVRSPYRDAYRSLAFMLACNESMETGKSIKVEY